MCTSSILIFNVNLCINPTLKINNMCIEIIASCENLCWTRWNVHFKEIINPFIFIKFTEVIFKIISYVERLDGRTITSYVPNINSWIISAEDIVITLKGIMYTANSPYKFIEIISFLFIGLWKPYGWLFWLRAYS